MLRAMRVRGHHLALMTLLLAVSLGVAACSEPTPAAKVPRTSSSPLTATPSSSPAKLTPEQEVEAAVRAYYAELTRAAQTNDTSKLRKLMHKNCPCYRVLRSIDETAREGSSTPDAEWVLREVKLHDVYPGVAGAEVRYTVKPYTALNSAGEVTDSFPQEDAHLDLSLVRANGAWIISNVFDLEAG